jgi:uncharacterized membrane protein YhhN
MGRAQLWRDIRDQPLRSAGFAARKVTRIWVKGQRDVMEEPGWAVLHAVVVALGLLGLALLALRRRWEALLIGSIFLAITLISALLVASPRRVLVLMPLVAALAGFAAVELAVRARRLRTRGAARPPATI